MDDETGMNNCVEGLKQIMGLAEKNGVMIQMELLNSKVDHKDYMCDKTPWGVELVKRIGSPNFKLLYDIYHMQIDEGDVIRSIQNYNQHIGHYHTAGCARAS
jgi:hydroxypyruvate isomerase